MNQFQRILLFLILPVIAPLFLTPEWFQNAGFAFFVGMIVVMGVIASVFMLRGYSLALTLTIFLQGLNVIIRLMMFWPHFANPNGGVNLAFGIASLLSLALSAYLVLRLDKVDVRVQMIR